MNSPIERKLFELSKGFSLPEAIQLVRAGTGLYLELQNVKSNEELAHHIAPLVANNIDVWQNLVQYRRFLRKQKLHFHEKRLINEHVIFFKKNERELRQYTTQAMDAAISNLKGCRVLCDKSENEQMALRLFIPREYFKDERNRHAFLAEYCSLEWDLDDDRWHITNTEISNFHIQPVRFTSSLLQKATNPPVSICRSYHLFGPLGKWIDPVVDSCAYYYLQIPCIILCLRRQRFPDELARKILSFLTNDDSIRIFRDLFPIEN